MRKVLVIFLSLYCLLSVADTTVLDSLFAEGERCYMTDNYRKLQTCIELYDEYLSEFMGQESGDLVLEYAAYSDKMKGAYYYGLYSEDNNTAQLAYRHYAICLDAFRQLHKEYQANVVMQELAQLFYKDKNYLLAELYLELAADYLRGRVELGISQDEEEYIKVLSNLAMCNARQGDCHIALQRIDTCLTWQRKHRAEEQYETLRRKGKILMLCNGGGNKEARQCYEQYVDHLLLMMPERLQTMNESEREQHWLATHQFLYDCVRLGNDASERIFDLALFTKGYLQNFNRLPHGSGVSWKNVRSVLKNDECAVEFLQYQGEHDENRLAAIVLRSDSKKPVFIDIMNVDSLMSVDLNEQINKQDINNGDDDLWGWSYTPKLNVKALLESTDASHKSELYENKKLRNAVWTRPLMAAIGNARKVMFAPDGFLHQYAIEYIVPDDEKIAYRLSSTRVLYERRKQKSSRASETLDQESKALLVGGVNFEAAVTPHNRGNDVHAYNYLRNVSPYFKYLNGSKHEIDSIRLIRQLPTDSLLTGAEATDENVRQLISEHYPIVHLSTHGYFLGKINAGTDLKPAMTDNSMSESGLVFSGAASSLDDWFFDDDLDDGILSAKELSQLDMQGVKLFVLSACQTGLGYVTADGVFGLGRAVKQAGAEGLIVSLWGVNDYSTCVLMRHFYSVLREKGYSDIHGAFMEARKRLMTQTVSLREFHIPSLHGMDAHFLFNEPQYVNPFILIDIF